VYPLVQILDDIGNTIVPTSIIHTSLSSFDVSFATTSSGTVVIGGGEGPIGPTGDPGPSYISEAWQGSWTSSAAYGVPESWVTYGGSTWFTNVGAYDSIPPSPTNSNWTLLAGAALIVGTSIPTSSSDTGSKGEIRVDNGEYLYIHTGEQWLKSSMTFSTF